MGPCALHPSQYQWANTKLELCVQFNKKIRKQKQKQRKVSNFNKVNAYTISIITIISVKY
mgnify:FL=1